MLMQWTQSRKSWKSRSQLVEIDTVDFLFRRIIYTCTCFGFIPLRGILGPRPIKKSSKCTSKFRRNPQILQFVLPPYLLYFVYWNRNLFDFFFFVICSFRFYFFIFYLFYLWKIMESSLFIEMKDSDWYWRAWVGLFML